MARLNSKRCFLEFACQYYSSNKCHNAKKQKCFISCSFFFKHCKEIDKEERNFNSLQKEKKDPFTGLRK